MLEVSSLAFLLIILIHTQSVVDSVLCRKQYKYVFLVYLSVRNGSAQVVLVNITGSGNARCNSAFLPAGGDLNPAHLNLTIGPCQVRIDCARADMQPGCDLMVGQTIGNHAEHLDFAICKPIGIFWRWRRSHDWM